MQLEHTSEGRIEVLNTGNLRDLSVYCPSDQRAARDVRLERLNENQAKISWKPPTLLQNAKLTYQVVYITERRGNWIRLKTKKTFLKINLTDDMTIIIAGVAYYDPDHKGLSSFYPQPFAQLEVSQKSGIFTTFLHI